MQAHLPQYVCGGQRTVSDSVLSFSRYVAGMEQKQALFTFHVISVAPELCPNDYLKNWN